MREIIIAGAEEGRRLDRYLQLLFPQAQPGFLYKMLRKKNITLNGKKASGKEILCPGDCIRVWFSEETWDRFSGKASGTEPDRASEEAAFRKAYPYRQLEVVFEDEDVIFINKPVGMMSQKASGADVSLCEYLIGFLAARDGAVEGRFSPENMAGAKPSVCNRLDRNTSGLVACGKTVKGLKTLTGLFRDREVHKTYFCIVFGSIQKGGVLKGFLSKDRDTNQVFVSEKPSGEDREIITEYEPVKTGMAPGRIPVTLLSVSPVTGRSHQIRAHLAWAGHPLAGDHKYAGNEFIRWSEDRLGLHHQLLHCAGMTFPGSAPGVLSGKTIEAPLPAAFENILQRIDWGKQHS